MSMKITTVISFKIESTFEEWVKILENLSHLQVNLMINELNKKDTLENIYSDVESGMPEN